MGSAWGRSSDRLVGRLARERVVEVELDALDTDEVADEVAVAVEGLLESGWTIDWGLPEEQDG